ncbi:hypothetical protein JHD46_07015, partial [Sulfurimonas sp. SAG-AH-194-C20]
MQNTIATVQGVKGQFFSKDLDGNVVALKEGDIITEGMLVFGDKSNSSTAQIEMSRADGTQNITLTQNQEQVFDASLSGGDSLEDAGLFSDSIDDALTQTAGLDEDIYSDEVLSDAGEEEDSADDEETTAGDEKIKDEEAGAEFAERDGNAVDVNSGLRDAAFRSISHTYEIEDRFKREDEEGLDKIPSEPNNPTPPAPPTPPTPPAPPVVQVVTPEVSINDVTIDEVNGFMIFTVTSTSPAGSDITFSYKSVDGSAIDGTDYTGVTGTATITAGQSSTTIEVPIIDDYYAELTEQFSIVLSDISANASIDDGTGIGTILDNGIGTNTSSPSERDNPNSPNTSNGYDSEDTVFVKLIDSDTQNEGTDLTHNIKLIDGNGNDVLLGDGESVTVTLTYTPANVDPAIEGTDYTATTTVTITGSIAGNGSASIVNPTLDDIFTENDESYTISINTITDNAGTFENILDEGATVTGTIVDDAGTPSQETTQVLLIALDATGVAILDGSGNYTFINGVNEDDAGNYMALAFSSTETTFNASTQLSSQLGSVVVSSLDTGSATSNVDYTAQTQTIALNTAFSIDTLDDNIADNGETYNVKIDSYVDPTTGTTYESVVVNTQEVTTTITDNTGEPESTGTPPEVDSEDTIVKLIALDTNGDAILDGSGNYTFTNGV